jgi:hypothetical protein
MAAGIPSRHLEAQQGSRICRADRTNPTLPVPTVPPDAAPLEQVSSWAGQCRSLWEERFDRMDQYVAQIRPERKAGKHNG